MKKEWERPYAYVCDNVEMAEFFIKMARESRADLRQRWCLNIAAGALYSAIDVYNKCVAQVTGKGGAENEEVDERLRLSPRAGTSQVDQLVNLIRHGAVHFQQPQGVGESFTPGQQNPKAVFYWVETRRGKKEEFPIGEILEALTQVADLIRKHGLDTTKTWCIGSS